VADGPKSLKNKLAFTFSNINKFKEEDYQHN
jgi:hypothetical protein